MTKPDLLLPLCISLLWMGCKEESIPDAFKPNSAHEGYVHSLKQAGLLDSELGLQFVTAAENAIRSPIQIETPHQEHIYFQADQPKAMGYVFKAIQGEKVNIQIEPPAESASRLFIDLFRQENNEHRLNHVHIASADRDTYTLGFEPNHNTTYVLRIQSELLHSGNYTITIINKASYDFPVSGKGVRSIGSFFGDPRDGGRRKHHGIDIFAARHTPIISPANGTVRFAGEKGRGGRVVWLRDYQKDQTLYFAHLQSIMVETGTEVNIGDTLGTVGNTGNARTTPPHLHFGIYRRGPIDPYHFVANQNPKLKEVNLDKSLVGTWVRIKSTKTVRAFPVDSSIVVPKYQVGKIEAALNRNYRVSLSSDQYILLPPTSIESLEQPIGSSTLAGDLFSYPDRNSVVLNRNQPKSEYPVLGIDRDFRLVRLADLNTVGWMMK